MVPLLVMLAPVPWCAAESLDGAVVASKHDFVLPSPTNEPLLGLLLGNGDLGASIWADGETLVFTLGKNDVWDRRFNDTHDRPIITFDELVEQVVSGTWNFSDPNNYYCSQAVEFNFSPTPKPVGQVRLTGLGQISNLHLRLVDATLTFDTPNGKVAVIIERARNVVFIRVPAEAAKKLQVDIYRPRETLDWSQPSPPPASFMSQPSKENAADPANAPLAPPETGITEDTFWVLQRIPAEPTYPEGFSVAVAAIVDGARSELSQETDRAVCKITSTQKPWVTIAVGVRTTGDGDTEPAAGACRLAEDAADDPWKKIHTAHAAEWAEFWSRSAIEITASNGEKAQANLASTQDAALAEELFYRNVYLLGCCIRPGAVAPSLNGNWIWMDLAPWHGIYMLDYNFQQTFWPTFICNHADLAQPYFDRICQTFPIALKNTPFAYGKEAAGATFNPGDYPIRHDGMLYAGYLFNPIMETSAWVMQHFWHQWQYVGDREFLEQKTYPMMVEVARFYEWLLQRTQREDLASLVPKDGRLHILPTFSPEHWGTVSPKFVNNRDSASAIAFTRYHLLATAEAADVLGRDAEKAARWRALATNLSDYPTFESPEGTIFVDVRDAPPIEYNNPVPLFPVFPGEDPTLWANPRQIEIARRTAKLIQTNGNNSMVALGVERARLGIDDSLAQFLADVRKRQYPNGVLEMALADKCPRFMKLAIFTENFAAAGVVAEHLLQSHPDATGKPLLRLFPVLPTGMDARFAGLVGEGAFEVSAERKQGRVTEVKITSRRGAPCRLLNPWGTEKARLKEKGGEIQTLEGNVLEFPTRSGSSYTLVSTENVQ
ncbi:MAG: hypothetical protein K1Y02_11465 [Candidatus Hydrogenedentes bacterium]|nr:hypothetical protein [Candidatus Hydrogenedentota bacterium]